METIQVVIDAKLLEATDRLARQEKLNRSELVRRALREHLEKLRTLDLEELDRRGYQTPSTQADADEATAWESEAAWPGE